tara:strand:- start:9374 stop:9559 length:186 start_codon:yes stop_codon:yes gene_type:complete
LKPTKADNNVSTSSSSEKAKRRCLFCGQEAELIWVHGHGQCAACGINAEECCRGESCDNYQ